MKYSKVITFALMLMPGLCLAADGEPAKAVVAPAPAVSTGIKVAVVDEARLLDEYEKSLKLVSLLEEKFNEEKTALTALKSEMEKLKEGIDSPVHSLKKKEELADTLHKREIEVKIRQESTTEEINRKRELYTQQVYEDMLAAIGHFSTEKGYDLILRKNLPRMRRDQDAQLLVLFNKQDIDITDQVLKLMNAKYKQELAGK